MAYGGQAFNAAGEKIFDSNWFHLVKKQEFTLTTQADFLWEQYDVWGGKDVALSGTYTNPPLVLASPRGNALWRFGNDLIVSTTTKINIRICPMYDFDEYGNDDSTLKLLTCVPIHEHGSLPASAYGMECHDVAGNLTFKDSAEFLVCKDSYSFSWAANTIETRRYRINLNNTYTNPYLYLYSSCIYDLHTTVCLKQLTANTWWVDLAVHQNVINNPAFDVHLNVFDVV